VRELVERLRKFRDDRDWDRFHAPKDLAVSVCVEAGELLELFQWRPEGSPLDASLIERIGDEAADVLLYLLMLCDKAGIDLMAAARQKIDRNEARFPVARSFGVAKPLPEREDP